MMGFRFKQRLGVGQSDDRDERREDRRDDRDDRAIGIGLPTRVLPKLIAVGVGLIALYVAFHGQFDHSSRPAEPANTAPPPAQASAQPHPSELRTLLSGIEGHHKPHHAKPAPQSSGTSNLLSGAMPSATNIKNSKRAAQGNIAASQIIALQGTSNSSSNGGTETQTGSGNGSGDMDTSRFAVPSGQPVGPVTHIQLPASLRKRHRPDARTFLAKMAKATGHGYGPQAAILPPLPGAVLYPGAVLPSTTITAVNTQLPGSVIAQVTNNVYGRNGRIAVPAGSRLVGQYDTTISNGQTRVLVAFSRVIFPDGRELVLGNAQSAGKHGATGTKADVHNHFFKMLGASLLVALLDQGVSAVGPTNSVASPTGATYSSPGQAGAQVFANTAGKVLSPYTDMQPTAVIPAGTAINVLVNKTVTIPQQGAGQ